MKIFDISRPLTNRLVPFPGDTPFCFELKWKIAEGAAVNVGALETSVHNGSHTDAPFHFEPGGRTIDLIPLETYFGDAVVVDLSGKFDGEKKDETRRIRVTDLEPSSGVLERAPRLLLKTGIWQDPESFPAWIPVIAPDVPAWLHERGVRLIGLDLPSVDPIDAKEMINHRALDRAGIAILESLDLSAVGEGTYHFSALPLKIIGADAAPVRAILWRD